MLLCTMSMGVHRKNNKKLTKKSIEKIFHLKFLAIEGNGRTT